MPQFEDSANPVDPFAFLANYSDETLIATIQDVVKTVGPILDTAREFHKRNEGLLRDLTKCLKSVGPGLAGALITADESERDKVVGNLLNSSEQVNRLLAVGVVELGPLIMSFAAKKLRDPEAMAKVAEILESGTQQASDGTVVDAEGKTFDRDGNLLSGPQPLIGDETPSTPPTVAVKKPRGPFDPLA